MPDPLGDFSYAWPFYAAPLVGYLLGSIPFGLIFTRLAGQGDIRALGSGNIGATNVLRTTNKTLALLTLLFDAAKGGVPVALCQLYLTQDFAVLVGGGALVGHIFPLWLRFRGGKGVATGLGILLGVGLPLGLSVCAIWLAIAVAFRYASVAALAAFAAAPVCAWYLANLQLTEFAVLLAVLVFVRHFSNMRDLFRGEETHISLGGRKQASRDEPGAV